MNLEKKRSETFEQNWLTRWLIATAIAEGPGYARLNTRQLLQEARLKLRGRPGRAQGRQGSLKRGQRPCLASIAPS